MDASLASDRSEEVHGESFGCASRLSTRPNTVEPSVGPHWGHGRRIESCLRVGRRRLSHGGSLRMAAPFWWRTQGARTARRSPRELQWPAVGSGRPCRSRRPAVCSHAKCQLPAAALGRATGLTRPKGVVRCTDLATSKPPHTGTEATTSPGVRCRRAWASTHDLDLRLLKAGTTSSQTRLEADCQIGEIAAEVSLWRLQRRPGPGPGQEQAQVQGRLEDAMQPSVCGQTAHGP